MPKYYVGQLICRTTCRRASVSEVLVVPRVLQVPVHAIAVVSEVLAVPEVPVVPAVLAGHS